MYEAVGFYGVTTECCDEMLSYLDELEEPEEEEEEEEEEVVLCGGTEQKPCDECINMHCNGLRGSASKKLVSYTRVLQQSHPP